MSTSCPASPWSVVLCTLILLFPVVAAAQGLGGKSEAGIADEAASVARYRSANWKPLWSDEFDQPGLPDAKKWGYEKGLVRNGEKQYYTEARPENANIAGGQLVITARREPWEGAEYTSASLTTKGKFDFTYGKIEIRAQVPKGKGMWPALWTLGANVPKAGWPGCGEIDIMEFVGFEPDRVHFTVHTKAFNHQTKTQRGTRIPVKEAWKEFHTYGLLWSPERIEWFFDGKPVFAFTNDGQGPDHWPFDLPQYLIMNLAVGGSWGGQQGIDETMFPATFRIDYVRAWSGK